MRARYIFIVGTIALVAALLLPFYQAMLAACGAIVLVGVVAFGFLLRPQHEVLYLRTTTRSKSVDKLWIEHGRIAIRIELTRLWILFVPTFFAVAFLIVIWARDSTWKLDLFDVIDVIGPHSAVAIVLSRIGEAVVLLVVGLLSEWISERWMLRDAAACSARSLSVNGRGVFYSFVDDAGDFYGGHAVSIAKYSAELANIVHYSVNNPALNRIAIAGLFHRVVIIGHGLTDLDQATVQARLPLVPSTN
jgi:hypothetical protein